MNNIAEKVRIEIVRVDVQRATEVLFGPRPIPVMTEPEAAHRHVGFGKSGIEGQAFRAAARDGDSISLNVFAPHTPPPPGVGQPGICRGVSRIEACRPFEMLDRP